MSRFKTKHTIWERDSRTKRPAVVGHTSPHKRYWYLWVSKTWTFIQGHFKWEPGVTYVRAEHGELKK